MDSCSEGRRVSEDSKFSSLSNNWKSESSESETEKSGDYGTVSPDGTELWGNDGEQSSPHLRERPERRTLLGSEARQRPVPPSKAPVPPARYSSLLSTLPQSSATSVKSKPDNSCATSSLVSESSEQSDLSLTAKKSPSSPKPPDRPKPERYQVLDGVHWLDSDRNSTAPSQRSLDGQVPLSDAPGSYHPSHQKSRQAAPPRSSSLASKESPQTRPGDVQEKAVKASLEITPAKSPPKKIRRYATPDELQEMKSMMRGRAMMNCKADPKVNRFEILYTDERYAHIKAESKFKALIGYVDPIFSKATSEQEQQRYYQKVSQLYIANFGDAGAKRLAEKADQLQQLDSREEKENFRNELLDNLIWKLTPNQRHDLRKEFKGLYGNSVLRDDTNWMFFDTIIRSHKMNDAAQRELMKEVFSASKETRLEKRDALRDSIHNLLTSAQRAEVKRVCKERHDSILYSRLPLFQLIIRENNIEAMKDYLDTVYLFTSPKHHFKCLESRCIRDPHKKEKDGNASFFNIVQWSSVEMMKTFLLYVLQSKTISFEDRFYLLSSYRLEDQVSAFHMIMAAGDFKRAKAFVFQIIAYFDSKEDYFDAFGKITRPSAWRLAGHLRPSTNNDLCAQLLLGHAPAPERSLRRINAYTRAIDHGYRKCAKNFSALIQPMWEYFKVYERDQARTYNKIEYDKNGDEFPEDRIAREARAKARKETLAKMRAKMSPEARQKELDDDARWMQKVLAYKAANAKILEDREKAIKEGRPPSNALTSFEKHMDELIIVNTLALRKHAVSAYMQRDIEVARNNKKILAKQKREQNPTPLQSAAKRLSSSFKSNSPATTPPPEKKRKFIRPSQFSPSIYAGYDQEKNPDGSPKPHTGPWLGEYKEPKKRKKLVPKVPALSDLLAYSEVGEPSEGG